MLKKRADDKIYAYTWDHNWLLKVDDSCTALHGSIQTVEWANWESQGSVTATSLASQNPQKPFYVFQGLNWKFTDAKFDMATSYPLLEDSENNPCKGALYFSETNSPPSNSCVGKNGINGIDHLGRFIIDGNTLLAANAQGECT